MKNREYMIKMLSNENFIDDGGASYEAMIYYHISCPYFDGDERCLCNYNEINRDTCVKCKLGWLDSEVEE